MTCKHTITIKVKTLYNIQYNFTYSIITYRSLATIKGKTPQQDTIFFYEQLP